MSHVVVTINPATEEVIDRHPILSDAEALEAVEACHAAFLDWRGASTKHRADIIAAIGEELKRRKDDLAALMTREMGKLKSQSEEEVDLCAAICAWTAENGPSELESEERELEDGERGIITYAPIGVVYGIQPWNFPCYQVIRYAIASLMAGNGVLLKHAENVTGSGRLIEEIFAAAGLPDNLFKALVITHDQSDDIIAHPRVRGVTLTGSDGAGRMVARQAGEQLKKTVLELGSNDAYIVLEDADLERAVKMCVAGRIYNNGETCVSAKRFIVVDAIYDDFRDAFVKAMQAVTYGDPVKGEDDMGPLARADLREDLHEQVEQSVAKGAKILCGGEIPDETGFYYPATVLEDVQPGQPAYEDELFGPVAALIRADDEADALRLANDSRYGLGGAIFSKDVKKAARLAAEQFDTGMVFINGFGLAKPNMPFGGVKDSGYGREHDGFGLKEFVNVKSVVITAE